ncbi:hypothetical protein [Paenibacillus massiliensis]|uniref:hypothetical protein n=1 Tax=Paenibacillus massiliensis TaxID=225917 RepID=UPI00036E7A2E|nr:hypothetical protein [Paenibacillus massiliensis]
MLRKIFAPVLAIGLLLSSGNLALAQEEPSYDSNRYTVIKEYSGNEISKNDISLFNTSFPTVDVNNDSEDYDIDVLENTTRPLYDLQDKNTGELVTQYATDVVLQATGRISDNNDFKSFSVKVYGTLYYVTAGAANKYVYVDKVDFRWENYGRTPGTKDHKVSVTQFGTTEKGAKANYNRTVNFGLSSSGTVVARDWNWAPVFASPDTSSVVTQLSATEVDAIGGTHPLSFVIRLY